MQASSWVFDKAICLARKGVFSLLDMRNMWYERTYRAQSSRNFDILDFGRRTKRKISTVFRQVRPCQEPFAPTFNFFCLHRRHASKVRSPTRDLLAGGSGAVLIAEARWKGACNGRKPPRMT